MGGLGEQEKSDRTDTRPNSSGFEVLQHIQPEFAALLILLTSSGEMSSLYRFLICSEDVVVSSLFFVKRRIF